MIVPAVILGTSLSAITMRLTRTMMLEVLRQDYIRTAWAKGLSEKLVVARHALRNALIPVVTLIGLQAPLLIGGAVIIEQIFVIPGMGLLLLDAVNQRDYPDHHRRVPDRRRGRDADQPAGRPELRPARPQGEVPLMAAVAQPPPSRPATQPRPDAGVSSAGCSARSRSAPPAAWCSCCSCSAGCSPTCSRPTACNQINPINRLKPPSWAFPFGTDNLGRDMLSRCLYGAQLSVIIGFCAARPGHAHLRRCSASSPAISAASSTSIMQRFVDAWQSFPDLIILIVVVSVVGPGMPQIIVTLGLLLGIAGSRIIRSAVVSVRENMYVHAAQSIGASTPRILWRHILPNVLPPIIVLFTTRVGTVILAESGLSFLGLGVPPPAPTWGGMLSGSGRTYMFQGPWLALAPGLCLTVVVYATNMFGDALRDLLRSAHARIALNETDAANANRADEEEANEEEVSIDGTAVRPACLALCAGARRRHARSRPTTSRSTAARSRSARSTSRSRRCRGTRPTGTGSTTTTPASSTSSCSPPTCRRAQAQRRQAPLLRRRLAARPTPSAASWPRSWEWKENPLRVEIKLRKGIMFPEKPGVMASRELIADDVVFSYNRLANSPKKIADLLRPRRQGRGDRQAHRRLPFKDYNAEWDYRFGWGYYSRHHAQGGGRRRRRQLEERQRHRPVHADRLRAGQLQHLHQEPDLLGQGEDQRRRVQAAVRRQDRLPHHQGRGDLHHRAAHRQARHARERFAGSNVDELKKSAPQLKWTKWLQHARHVPGACAWTPSRSTTSACAAR